MLFCTSMGSTIMGRSMLFCSSMGSTTMGRPMLFCSSVGSEPELRKIGVPAGTNRLEPSSGAPLALATTMGSQMIFCASMGSTTMCRLLLFYPTTMGIDCYCSVVTLKSCPNESVTHLWKSTCNHTNIQHDQYTSTKEISSHSVKFKKINWKIS